MEDRVLDDPAVLEEALADAGIALAVFDLDLRLVRSNAALIDLIAPQAEANGATVEEMLRIFPLGIRLRMRLQKR